MDECYYNGQVIDHNNLSNFLFVQSELKIIPSHESDVTLDENGQIKQINWCLEYSGAWGGGLVCQIVYNPNDINCWSAFFPDRYDENNACFSSRGINYDYSDKGFIVEDIIDDEGYVVISSDKLKNIIDYVAIYDKFKRSACSNECKQVSPVSC